LWRTGRPASRHFGKRTDAAPSAGAETTLAPVTVKDQREHQHKDTLRATRTGIGKGNQALRDVPQSITVVTEKLILDRNLDTLKEVLHSTGGVSFQAAEGGEEDIRLRGFSLAATGDIFLDGMRDPAFYDRDTFAHDRVELLRGSASMLFGRGSTGGAANQVSKLPHLFGDNEANLTVGSRGYVRLAADLSHKLGDNAALRLNAMHTQADGNGAGSGIEKSGIHAAVRFGIGMADEWLASVYVLDNRNPRPNYGLPYHRSATPTGPGAPGTPGTPPAPVGPSKALIQADQDPNNYFGMKSDRNAGQARVLNLTQTHKFGGGGEIKTQLRWGQYDRDLRASAIRWTSPTTTIATAAASSALNRGTNLKVQDVTVAQWQSDYSTKFQALGLQHELTAGVDLSRENKVVYAARSAAQGGVTLTKPTTLWGTPSDGASVDESARVFRVGNEFTSRAVGVYAQDLIQLAPAWKLLAGLRYDSMQGKYLLNSLTNNAPAPLTITPYEQRIGEFSQRLGALYQPNELTSWHLSYGTSFNTSGDTYSYNAQSANTDPEKSRNIELGAKLETPSKRLSIRFAAFYAEKYNERNTDPDNAATKLLLSGKRHTAGLELDVMGRITPAWEIYTSLMWMPVAKVDKTAPCPVNPTTSGPCSQASPGERAGDRPGLTPKWSGSVWSTYQIGVNVRSTQSPAGSLAYVPGYATLDLLTEYRISETYVVKVNLNNAADKHYADVLYRGHYVPGAGRTLQATLNARF
jgi:catecholate siderophore receptor